VYSKIKYHIDYKLNESSSVYLHLQMSFTTITKITQFAQANKQDTSQCSSKTTKDFSMLKHTDKRLLMLKSNNKRLLNVQALNNRLLMLRSKDKRLLTTNLIK
jgi:hypothetical protein